MKKSLTLALTIVALIVLTDFSVAQQMNKDKQATNDPGLQEPLPAPKSATAQATCSITKPTQGMPTMPYHKRCTPLQIQWNITGFTGPVKLYLIDYCAWAAYCVIKASTPNNGHYTWTMPCTIPCGIYQVYVQNVGSPINWCYSGNFAVTK